MDKDSLLNSYNRFLDIIFYLENDKKYVGLNTKCEVNLGKRGLYTKIGGIAGMGDNNRIPIFKWLLNYSDGYNSLIDISSMSGFKFTEIVDCSKILLENKLIK